MAPSYEEGDIAAMSAAVSAERLDSGDIAARFERAIAGAIGGARAEGTPSGTAALHLALVAAGVSSLHEVITPSYTCIAVLNAIHMVGARPVLVDNLDVPSALDFNIDPDRALAARTSRTRAIIVPHAFGVTADIGALLAEDGIAVIEDCAMALGSSFRGMPAGSRGHFATFSFHPSKVISTGGGGMTVAGDDRASDSLRAANSYLSAQRHDRTAPVEAVRGSYSYACGYQLTDPHAALGLAQLARLPALIQRRREIASWYTQELDGTGAGLPREIPAGGFPFRYQLDLGPLGLEPVALIEALAARGVEAGRGVYPALHHYLGSDRDDFPNAERCTRDMLSLPVHPALTDLDVEKIVMACRDAISAT